MKNRSHRYNINRFRPRHGHKYASIKCITARLWLYVLSKTKATFEAQLMNKLSNTEFELKRKLYL